LTRLRTRSGDKSIGENGGCRCRRCYRCLLCVSIGKLLSQRHGSHLYTVLPRRIVRVVRIGVDRCRYVGGLVELRMNLVSGMSRARQWRRGTLYAEEGAETTVNVRHHWNTEKRRSANSPFHVPRSGGKLLSLLRLASLNTFQMV
jgi:hypothetical protein